MIAGYDYGDSARELGVPQSSGREDEYGGSKACQECGQEMIVGPHDLEDSPGVTHHIDEFGAIDHNQDADHVAVASMTTPWEDDNG